MPGIGPRDEIITTVNIELCPISLQIHSQWNQSFLVQGEGIIYHSDVEFHKCRKQREGNKWLEHEEGSPETMTKMRPGKEREEEKKKKTEEATECFLMSSGGLAFV